MLSSKGRALCDRMHQIIEGYDESHKKFLGYQVVSLLEDEKINLKRYQVEFLETLEDPVSFLIDLSQCDRSYEILTKNMAYHIRTGLNAIIKDL